VNIIHDFNARKYYHPSSRVNYKLIFMVLQNKDGVLATPKRVMKLGTHYIESELLLRMIVI
jgi:hypothetical protein